MRGQKDAPAVSRKPMAFPDALVSESHGLTEEDIRSAEGVGEGISVTEQRSNRK